MMMQAICLPNTHLRLSSQPISVLKRCITGIRGDASTSHRHLDTLFVSILEAGCVRSRYVMSPGNKSRVMCPRANTLDDLIYRAVSAYVRMDAVTGAI